jgi:hypothetical protein
MDPDRMAVSELERVEGKSSWSPPLTTTPTSGNVERRASIVERQGCDQGAAGGGNGGTNEDATAEGEGAE